MPAFRHLASLRNNRAVQTPQLPLDGIGFDFGTTNSSVALVDGNSQVQLASFPSLSGETQSFRSVLYFDQLYGIADVVGRAIRRSYFCFLRAWLEGSAVPLPSTKDTNRSPGPAGNCSRKPLGQKTSMRSKEAAAPSPK